MHLEYHTSDSGYDPDDRPYIRMVDGADLREDDGATDLWYNWVTTAFINGTLQ